MATPAIIRVLYEIVYIIRVTALLIVIRVTSLPVTSSDISYKLSWGRGERPKLGEPCPKVRLSQDRMAIVFT